MSECDCYHCGYDLTGLGRAGVCPECGQDYDLDTLYRTVSRQEHAAAKYWKAIVLGLVTLCILVCGGLVSAIVSKPMGPVMLTLLIASVPAFGSFVYWWSERKEDRERKGL